MTQQLDIQIVQGQRWTYLFEVAGLVEAGNGLRLHIRDHHGSTLLRAGLTHDGATNARVSFTDGGVLANLGATISTGWDLQGQATRRWVYSVERYSLTDADDVTVTHAGAAIIIANPTDENSVDEVAPFPSFNLFALRFDIEQVLTSEQKARVLAALGITGSGGGASVHSELTGLDAADSHPQSAITGLVSALAGKETAGSVATHDADTGAHGQTATGRALVTAASTAAARTAIALGNVDNTSDANKPVSSATQTALDAKQSTAEKGSANGYASLDSGGKVPQAQLPAIAITEYLGEVASQSAMLALSGQKGDWCIRTDTGAVWIITGTDPTLLGSWTSVSYPASPVTSVAGRTGDVTISAEDVSGLSTVATTGAYSDLSGKPTLGTAAATDATDYATAAQGAKADTAVQPARAISAQHSLTGGGDLSADRTLALVNDTASPGNNKVYGTDGSGTRGWKDDPAGGGSPAGSGTEPQYRNGSSFGAMSGVSWDDTNRAETRTGATVTTSNPVQSFTQTWNDSGVVFTGWKINITNTASAAGSKIMDWQVGGSSVACITKDGFLRVSDITSASNLAIARVSDATTGIGYFSGSWAFYFGGSNKYSFSSTQATFSARTSFAGYNLDGYRWWLRARTSGLTLSFAESGHRFTNKGAAGEITFTLPTVYDGADSYLGQHYEFFVYEAQYLKIAAPGTETIRDGSTVSAGGGYIRSNSQGTIIRVTKVAAGEWFAEVYGTATVDS